MKGQTAFAEKENRHPNRKVIEEDISKIAKTYVFDGQRVKAKSIVYKEQSHSLPPTLKTLPIPQNFTQKDFHKLQYLQKMGVLTEAEQATLQQLRKINQSGNQRAREPLSNMVQQHYSQSSPQNTPSFEPWQQSYSDYPQEGENWESEFEPSYQQNYEGIESQGYGQSPCFSYQQNAAKHSQF